MDHTCSTTIARTIYLAIPGNECLIRTPEDSCSREKCLRGEHGQAQVVELISLGNFNFECD